MRTENTTPGQTTGRPLICQIQYDSLARSPPRQTVVRTNPSQTDDIWEAPTFGTPCPARLNLQRDAARDI